MQQLAAKHYPFLKSPLPQAHSQPRLFELSFDYSKLKSANPLTREQHKRKQFAYGVLWPSTDAAPSGGVSLSNSNYFHTLEALRDYHAEKGRATLTWEDGEVEEIG